MVLAGVEAGDTIFEEQAGVIEDAASRNRVRRRIVSIGHRRLDVLGRLVQSRDFFFG